jgi:serine/threonine protein kinase/tetratricopeptide (TPR) repeat protein
MGESVPLKSHSAGSGTAEPGPSLTPARWQRIKELFGLALERESDQRAAFLQQACGDDSELRAEVESLLESAESYGAATSEVFKSVTLPGECQPSEVEDALIGRRIGDYRIDQRIGIGGMAAVYLASRADEQFHMQAAIKLLRPDMNHADLLRRFLKERQTLAALDHPNIVKLLDGGSTETGLPYLVMDYVEGKPIDEYCDDHNLQIQKRLQLFCTVCESVEFAHQHRVIHRDLKPNNILVTADGVPKLLDFGIAKVLGSQDQTELTITRTAIRHLTPAYASPEQVRGERITAATDVYSLGVVLYELLTGHRPYRLKQRTPAAMERAICEQEPESPSTAVDRVETESRPDGTVISLTVETVSRARETQPEKLRHSLKGDLDNILFKALQKDPQRRYQTIAQFEHDIRRHLDHRPVLARPNTLRYRASKFIRRHTTELLALLAVVMILAAAVAFLIWQEHSAIDRARTQLGDLPSRGRRSVAVLGFTNLSAKPDTAWISTALAEMLTTDLAAGGTLRILDGEQVARAKLELSLPESDSLSKPVLAAVYKDLGSDYVIVGSYVDTDGGVRLNLRLQDEVSGQTIASLSEAGRETALVDLASRVGAELRTSLGVVPISPADLANARASMPSNLVASRYFSEGLSKLRVYDALGARDSLQKAAAADPNFALVHSALSEDWVALGYDEKAKEESKRALNLSSNLSRENRLLIEARYREANGEWSRAAQIYSALFEFFPDNVDYGIKLAVSQKASGVPKEEALPTIDSLKSLPSPLGDDPRIDLLEHDFYGLDSVRAQAALARALQRAASSGALAVMAQGRLQEGDWYKASGNLTVALSSTEAARDLFEKMGNQNGVALAMNEIGNIYLYQGDRNNARTMFENALTINRAIGNEKGIADSLSNLGYVVGFQGDQTAAENMFREALNVTRGIQSKWGMADTLNYYATTREGFGDLLRARSMFEDSKGLFREIRREGGVSVVTARIGQLLLVQGDLARAERACIEVLTPLRTGTDMVFLGRALSTLGNVLMAKDRLPEARKDHEEAEGIRRRIGVSEDDAQSQLFLARLAIIEGRFKDAAMLANQAKATFHKYNASLLESYTRAVLAESLIGQAEFEKAHGMIREALPWTSKPAYLEIRLPFAIAVARVLAASSHYTDAQEIAESRRILDLALRDAKSHGYLGYEFEARLALGELETKVDAGSKGREQLAVLEREARGKGFLLIARQAAESRNRS